MRVAGYAFLALSMLSLAPLAAHAGELRIAAWNLEHLDDSDGDGCVGRNSADYAALARRIQELDADVVAFQEVENAAAAHRVFPASAWHIEMSRRPATGRSRACWGKPGARLGQPSTVGQVRPTSGPWLASRSLGKERSPPGTCSRFGGAPGSDRCGHVVSSLRERARCDCDSRSTAVRGYGSR